MSNSRWVVGFGIGLLLPWVILGPPESRAAQSNGSGDAIGRENPFSAIEAVRPVPVSVEAKPPEAEPQEAPEENPDLLLETVVLKFLDATSLKTVLDKMVTSFGMVAVNKQNNSVVICDTPENLAKILAEVKKADRIPPQVMVEVVILDVQLKNDTEIGINWDLLSDNRYDVIYRQNVSSSRLRSTVEDAETIGNATAFNTVGLGGDFSVISGTIRHVLHVLQQKRDVDILASPSTLVVSGQSATIQAVEEIPYKELIDSATGGQEALSTTQFKDVGVTLQVTATVTDGNSILVTVTAEQNVRTGASDQGVPVVDTRRANTSLLLDDGQIVVMGGLRRQEKTEEVSQVPLLGDLPLIGYFFKSRRMVTNRSELVVLLSPHIHNGEPLPSSVAARYEALRGASLLSEGDPSRAERSDVSEPSSSATSERPGSETETHTGTK
ncbi:MAG: type II and III secretion system protein [Phycisphaerae bacterium]|nr:type II and III secretion system protein [Phycisphaerae bacterium]